jgi:geranylgeranyl diphosphate synthase, type I
MQQRYQPIIETALRERLDKVQVASGISDLDAYYGQMRYHLGWVDASFVPLKSNPGKMLRSLLLLLAYEATGAWGLAHTTLGDMTHLQRALPAAVAIELTHNFTLIHDDIEDRDTERRHRPTIWKCWGVPQAINTGSGMFALSRQALWDALDNGVESTLVARLGKTLDRTVQIMVEGQYLDLSFETRQDVSITQYLEMIRRKTSALMSCAAEMGALLGTQERATIESLRMLGQAIGIAFQLRDDILGVWATTTDLGKMATGDLYRRKKSLPILHALENASERDEQILRTLYQQESAMMQEQADTILAIFKRTQTRDYCRTFLAEQCRFAHEALATVPYNGHSIARRAIHDLEILVHFVEETT